MSTFGIIITTLLFINMFAGAVHNARIENRKIPKRKPREDHKQV